jgi:hypothetical protein
MTEKKGFDRLLCMIKKHYDTFLKKYENVPKPITADELCEIASDIILYHLTYA